MINTGVEFNKYEKNQMHANAVAQIGEKIAYYLNDINRDITYYEGRIRETIDTQKENDPEYDPKDDWQITSWVRSIEEDKEQLSLWKKIESLIDKELNF